MHKAIAVAGSSACLLSACVGRKADAPGTDGVGTQRTASAATAPTLVTIIAKDFSYDAPDTIGAGMVTLRLVNQGPELHHVQLVRLDEGHTVAELAAGLKQMKPGDPPPPWVHDIAGPNTPVPGGEQSITEELAPGHYAIVCMIPSADHQPHAMKGMVRALTIIPATGAPAVAPAADIDVRMSDFSWSVSPQITAGRHVMRIENDAPQPHEMFVAQLSPGKKPADLAKWVENMQGPPPAKPIGGITGMSQHGVAFLPVDLTPGVYGLFCFLPDAKDGRTHIEHGMMTQFTVQ
jgi:hypothetical protein